jgi:hypothetical protein
MSVKIRFELIENNVSSSQLLLEVMAIEELGILEKQMLIGLLIEVDGKSYKVVNQIVEPASRNSQASLVFYVTPDK